MKKYLITTLLSLIAISYLHSQPKLQHYNNWIFGDNVGITFSTADGNPKALALSDSYESKEGFSSVSDDEGNLLYYIYYNIYNINIGKSFIKNDKSIELPNGDRIFTGYTSVSSALFINDITNSDIYYLITADGARYNQFDKTYLDHIGINYSIIDKSKGEFGEVIKKNIKLFGDRTDKIAGVMNLVDKICWVIMHEWNTNAFKLIKIDKNGLDTNLKTVNVGKRLSTRTIKRVTGRLAVSPTGTTIAMPYARFDKDSTEIPIGDVELFDFDPRNGEISNPRSLNLKEDSYALAFSPNGKVLYVRSKNRIIQYNLSLLDIDKIIETRFIIDTKLASIHNSIDRGPNGVIYCNRNGSLYLDAILNPDVIGAGCNYTEDLVNVGGYCNYGFAPVISSYFNGKYDYNSSVLMNRGYEVDLPESACYGDDFDIRIKSNFNEEYEARIESITPNPKVIGIFTSKDSLISISTSNEDNLSLATVTYNAFITTESAKYDTLTFTINNYSCCGNIVHNGQFNSISSGKICGPIDFNTDLNFHASENAQCQLKFTSSGQIATSSKAQWHNDNFEREPKSPPYFLIGDPMPNVEHRAWFQKTETKKGKRHKFTAFVSNIEKINRVDKSDTKSLSFWLAVKMKDQQFNLKRIDNVKYSDGWIEISDEFIATENNAELSIWVLGDCSDKVFKCTSYGFGIDDISLMSIDEPELTLQNDTTICIYEPLQINNIFTGEIESIEWSPQTGLSNPSILNPIISPSENTEYTLTIKDKFYCEFTKSLNIVVDSCIKKCYPCVSIFIKDDSVSIGERFCINGEFIPVCNSKKEISDFSLYFEYNPNLMAVTSATTDYQLLEISEKSIIKLNFDDYSVKPNETNEFSICFDALLGDTNITQLSVYSDEETEKEICLNDISIANIGYESCAFPVRRVKFFGSTALDVIVEENRLALNLTTEEQGLFKFVLVDPTGRIISQKSYTTSKDKYENEEITFFELNDLSSGVYFIRMQTPSGKLVSQKILITK